MTYEFEGRTEKEAIDCAAEELGLEKDDFDVEILESQKQGIFKKGLVRIRVHTEKHVSPTPGGFQENGMEIGKAYSSEYAVDQNEFEEKLTGFVTGLINHMGYSCKVSVLFREKAKLGLKIDSENSSILIGKKGKKH